MAMERTIYREIPASRGVWQVAALLAAVLAAAAGAVLYIEHEGHIVTGMTNRVVWGLPHVFAIFLIVAASGALNVASVASVFGQAAYKPMARLSGLLALALLAGGLAVLVLDLGRPDRLIVAMTHYNFRSIFAWNIFLYTGFMGLVAAYLFVQMARGMGPAWIRGVGLAAFLWRLVLTTGTGSIFGWLVARPGYDAAVMAPLFVAMSLSFGTAVFILVTWALCRLSGRALGAVILRRLARLMAIFAAVVLYFTAVQHLTNLYAAEHGGFERFILRGGGGVTWMFWAGQVLIGGLVPLALIYHPATGNAARTPLIAAGLIVLGGFAQIWVIVIGGQLFPQQIFAGYEAVWSLSDGAIATYVPRWPEWLLGLGGVALALLITGLGAKILRILPTSLSDVNIGQAG